jgi:hypothetical protein
VRCDQCNRELQDGTAMRELLQERDRRILIPTEAEVVDLGGVLVKGHDRLIALHGPRS